jgi:hypothetical protein
MFNLGSTLAFADSLCPSCPTAVAARDLFFSGTWLTNTLALLGPFVITVGLARLVTKRLGGEETSP